MNAIFPRIALALSLCVTLTCAAHGGAPNLPADPQPLPDIAACDQFTLYGRPTLAASRPVTLLCRKAYISAHDDQRLAYDWVAWTLTAAHAMGCGERHNQFHTDHNLAPGKRAVPDDYLKTGYDQGHGFPDMDGTWDVTAQYESFLMSNMAPQAPGLNRQGWEQLEADSRAWAVAGLGPLTIYDVPIWSDAPKTIGADHVAVPDAFAKVVYSPVNKHAVAVIMPNAPVAKGDVGMYLVAVDDVEREAGITLPLPAGTDTAHVVVLWPVDAGGYLKAKRQACAH